MGEDCSSPLGDEGGVLDPAKVDVLLHVLFHVLSCGKLLSERRNAYLVSDLVDLEILVQDPLLHVAGESADILRVGVEDEDV
jgi:hypothetical protein